MRLFLVGLVALSSVLVGACGGVDQPPGPTSHTERADEANQSATDREYRSFSLTAGAVAEVPIYFAEAETYATHEGYPKVRVELLADGQLVLGPAEGKVPVVDGKETLAADEAKQILVQPGEKPAGFVLHNPSETESVEVDVEIDNIHTPCEIYRRADVEIWVKAPDGERVETVSARSTRDSCEGDTYGQDALSPESWAFDTVRVPWGPFRVEVEFDGQVITTSEPVEGLTLTEALRGATLNLRYQITHREAGGYWLRETNRYLAPY